MPVVAVVAVVVAVLSLLSVGVVVALDCGPVVKAIGVVVLSKTYTVTFTAQQNLHSRPTPVSFSCILLLLPYRRLNLFAVLKEHST